VLLGKEKLVDVVKATEVPDLFVLPCGPIPPNPAELCQSERFKTMLKELGERFDRVILDSPPVMVVTDAVVLSTIVDGGLIVARTGQTTRGGLRESVRQLTDVSATILGCVLNDMDLEKRGYGYYRYRRYGHYRYGYSRYGYGHYGEKEEEATS
jgi:polysaccharide biosynthesis transport protein